MKKLWWHGKPWQAFKNIALIFSFTVNLILVVVLLLVLPLVLRVVNEGVKPILGGLNDSFVEMNEASIRTTIPISEQIPIEFDVPLYTPTVVTLTEIVPLRNVPATFYMTEMRLGNGGVIYGSVSLDLPAALTMPIELGLDVPVRNHVPVELQVDVDIPLSETELNQPFTRLTDLFGPLVSELDKVPASNEALLQSLRPE